MRDGPGIWQALGLAMMFVVLQLFLGVGIALGARVLGTAIVPGDPMIVALVNVLSAAIVLAIGWAWSGRAFSDVFPLGLFRGAYCLPTVPLLIGLGIIASECDNIVRSFLPMPGYLIELFQNLTKQPLAAAFTLLIVAPLTEEFLVRGLMLTGFLKRYSERTSIVWSALVFALLHMNPYQFGPTLMVGVFFGWLFVKTRSLWPCVLAHAFFNAQVLLVPHIIPVEIPGYNPSSFDFAVVEFQPLWFDGLGLVLVVIGLAGFRIVERVHVHQQPDVETVAGTAEQPGDPQSEDMPC